MILWLLPFFASGQSYYFKRYQAEDGLAHNTVITILQDQKGFMWVGTKEGLNRFDGYTFKSFKNKQSGFGRTGNNMIISLCEDHTGMIWVGTNHGIFRFNPYTETFTALPIPPSLISNILADKNNQLWFLSNNELVQYDQRRNKVTNHHLSASCMAFDPAMNLWLGTFGGTIGKYDPLTNKASVIPILHNLPAGSRQISKLLWADSDQLLIGTTKQGLQSYHLKTGQLRSLLLRNKDRTEIFVRDIMACSPNTFWIATESGIYSYNRDKPQIENIRKQVGDNYSLSDNAVYCLYKDNRGGLWAGTFFGGLNYLSAETNQFKKYYPVNGINAISGNAVREICSDQQGNIWIGTEDAGLNKLDTSTGKFSHYTSTDIPSGLSYPNIHGMLAVGNRVYIGPFQHGLDVMDIRTGRIIKRINPVGTEDSRGSDFVMCIYLTRDSDLLIGTTGAGLFMLNEKNYRFKRVQQIPEDSHVYSIVEDHEGTIWTGSSQKGVFYYNPRTGSSGNIRFGLQKKSPDIPEYVIQGLFEDSDHFLWMATEGGGLIRLNKDHKSFERFTTANGLPSNSLFRILEDNQKNLWISSLKGLICMNTKSGKIKVYTQANGLITDQFNYNSAFKDRYGKMYFGSVKGMVAFTPSALGKRQQVPPTYITGFQISNTEAVPAVKNSPLKSSIIYTDSLVLDHDQSSFNIEFSTLGYSSPSVTRYKYFMKGLDRSWTYLNVNRKAYFTNLAAGNYTFIVAAESNVGNWTGKERVLFIKVLPPVWKSTLAYGLYFVILAGLIYLALHLYMRYQDRKNSSKLQLYELEKEKEIYQAKIEFFTNIAHEIQTPLTLIAGPVERILKKADDSPAIKKSLLMIEKNTNRLLSLTAQLLDFRKTEMNEFGLSFVSTDITALLADQAEIFRAAAEKRRMRLSLNFPKKPLVAFVDMEAFVKITGNLISNAIKYGESKVSIGILCGEKEEQDFRIRISNDGKPIPKELREKIFEPFFRIHGNEQPGTGIGLSLARSLAELHHGSLELVFDETNLITFQLTLPVHQKFGFELGNWKNMK